MIRDGVAVLLPSSLQASLSPKVARPLRSSTCPPQPYPECTPIGKQRNDGAVVVRKEGHPDLSIPLILPLSAVVPESRPSFLLRPADGRTAGPLWGRKARQPTKLSSITQYSTYQNKPNCEHQRTTRPHGQFNPSLRRPNRPTPPAGRRQLRRRRRQAARRRAQQPLPHVRLGLPRPPPGDGSARVVGPGGRRGKINLPSPPPPPPPPHWRRGSLSIVLR